MGEGNGTNKGLHPCQEEINIPVSYRNVGRSLLMILTQAYKAKVYRHQAFLVIVAPGPNRPLVWYPWESNDLKELRKALAKYGPNSPWAMTLLQEVAYHPFVPKDWYDLAKATLWCGGPQYVKWTAFFKEVCCKGQSSISGQPPNSYHLFSGNWYGERLFHWGPTSRNCGSVLGPS